MNETLKIGLIVKPQGVRGELKVQPLTDDVNRFRKLKEVLIDDKTYKVLNVTIGGGVVFVSISGIADRNVAETFRGKFLCVSRENAVKLEEGRYFIVDIIGCEVVTDNGENVGKVTDVTSARTDIFTLICPNDKVLRFPFLNDLVLDVNVEEKRIMVSEKRLKEVSCYED